MVINLSYGKRKSNRAVYKEVKRVLGSKSKMKTLIGYKGALISFGKGYILINMLNEDKTDLEFVYRIIDTVFPDILIGVSKSLKTATPQNTLIDRDDAVGKIYEKTRENVVWL